MPVYTPCSHPELHTALCHLLQATGSLAPDAAERLDALKEQFLETTEALLRRGGIDLETRLVIGLHKGVLTVIDRAHPQADTADALLGTAPELSTMLRRIAADTLVLRSLDELEYAVSLNTPHLSPAPCSAEEPCAPEFDAYRACFKGALSHCYRTQ